MLKGKAKIEKYIPSVIEKKWQKKWKEIDLYKSDLEADNKHYVLAEFAYPSGDLHMGHWFTFGGADIYARMKRMQGNAVFFPNGFDAFGLPAENAAIKRGVHPKDWTYGNIARMKEQYATMGASFSFDHEVITSDPLFYRWNQWLFLKMFEKGLAYRGKALSSWCPSCQTVLANEGIEEGKCWRCGTVVQQKEIEQWFFKITEYAERLIWKDTKKENGENSSSLVSQSPNISISSSVDWPQAVREGQNNWIGRSEGTQIEFKIQNSKFKIDVFTTRVDTLFGATFLVLAPEHPLLAELANSKLEEVKNYIEKAKWKTEMERKEQKEKTGVFTGLYVNHPITNHQLPIWVADYVLWGYGTGAIMAVPGHDMRDYEFASRFGLPIKVVILPDTNSKFKIQNSKLQFKIQNAWHEGAYEGEGVLINSGEFNGQASEEAKKNITAYLQEHKIGSRKIVYHLRDWSVSRQRYWGTPVPIIYCDKCWNIKYQISNIKYEEGRDFIIRNGKKYAIVPVAEKDLPVELPYDVDYTPKGKPPLASNSKWLNVSCPVCGGVARRDAETMDTFVDSSWYFFKYLSPDKAHLPGEKEHLEGVIGDGIPFDTKLAEKMMPVDIYFGGAEHTLGHTLYSRFVTKFFKDLGLIDFEEYAHKRVNHGVILGPDGFRMSKSRGNVVNPDEEVKKYGADAVRVYLAFFMPNEGTGPWVSDRVWGAHRFLQRIWALQEKIRNSKFEIRNSDLRMMHSTIKKVTEDIEEIKFNTAVAVLMEWLNYLSRKEAVSGEEYQTFLLLLAPFAPHVTEELWETVILERSGEAGEAIGSHRDSIGRSPKATSLQNDKPFSSVHIQPWPKYDEKYLQKDMVTIVVQVNGKVRSTFQAKSEKRKAKSEIEEIAKKDERVGKYLEGKEIKKVVYVEGKIINFVVE